MYHSTLGSRVIKKKKGGEGAHLGAKVVAVLDDVGREVLVRPAVDQRHRRVGRLRLFGGTRV